jgi:hypothetical protein
VKRLITVGVVAAVLALVAPLGAQESPAALPRSSPSLLVPLKLQLVLSRYQGDKKLSTTPYVLWVTANDRERTSLRMGVEVPIGSTEKGYNYRSVGTNIDCSAVSVPDGQYKLALTVTDSSVYFSQGTPDPTLGSITRAAPSFRSFSGKFTILLRDGQTAQYTAATDPVSGEVLKVDATLNVLK